MTSSSRWLQALPLLFLCSLAFYGGCSDETGSSGDREEGVECTDRVDNDDDGFVDCDDPDCIGQRVCQTMAENSDERCSDNLDNDGDTLIDCDDPECSELHRCSGSEDTAELCSDEIDNDNDQLTDCADPDCEALLFCRGAEENLSLIHI